MHVFSVLCASVTQGVTTVTYRQLKQHRMPTSAKDGKYAFIHVKIMNIFLKRPGNKTELAI